MTIVILLKFSGSERSSMENIAAKFRLRELVAMETVINSLFFSMTDISAGSESVVLKF